MWSDYRLLWSSVNKYDKRSNIIINELWLVFLPSEIWKLYANASNTFQGVEHPTLKLSYLFDFRISFSNKKLSYTIKSLVSRSVIKSWSCKKRFPKMSPVSPTYSNVVLRTHFLLNMVTSFQNIFLSKVRFKNPTNITNSMQFYHPHWRNIIL